MDAASGDAKGHSFEEHTTQMMPRGAGASKPLHFIGAPVLPLGARVQSAQRQALSLGCHDPWERSTWSACWGGGVRTPPPVPLARSPSRDTAPTRGQAEDS